MQGQCYSAGRFCSYAILPPPAKNIQGFCRMRLIIGVTDDILSMLLQKGDKLE
jgi:hypothetical protein